MIVPISFQHLDNEQLILLVMSADVDGPLRQLMQTRGWQAKVVCQTRQYNSQFRRLLLASAATGELLGDLTVTYPSHVRLETAGENIIECKIEWTVDPESSEMQIAHALRPLLAEHNLRWECSANW